MSLILYINGQRADLASGQAIAQTRQVNDLNSLENRQASYTNKFNLPKTANNLRILEHLTVTGHRSNIPYQKNECSLYSETGECFVYKGWAMITDGGEDFDVVIYDGIIDLYKEIENTTLGALNLSDINHDKTPQAITASWTNEKYRYIIADYNGATFSRRPFPTQYRINADYLIPSVRVSYLWEKIFGTYGFEYSGAVFNTEAFKNLWMTFPKGVLPSESNTQLLKSEDWGYQYYNHPLRAYYAKYNTAQVNAGLTVSQNMHMSVSQSGYYRMTIKCKLNTTSSNFPLSAYYFPKSAQVFLGKNTGALPANLAVPYRIFTDGLARNTEYEGSVLMQLQANDRLSIVICKATAESAQYGFYLHGDSTMDVLLEKLDITAINFNTAFADFSTRDFLTEIVQRFGLTMFKDKYRKHYEFLTLQEVLQTSDAEDWSGKLASKESESYTYGSYAQQNWLRYSYNSKDSAYNDDFIAIDNRNLPDTKDLIKSKIYSPEEDRRVLISRLTNVYKFWEREVKEDEELEIPVTTYKPLDKRYYLMRSMPYTFSNTILRSGILGTMLPVSTAPCESFWGLPFNDIVNDYYSNIGRVLNNALIVTAMLNLTETDIANFSFKKLYYFKQLGAYFIMNKISNYIPGKPVKCELVRVALLTDEEAAPPAPAINVMGVYYIMASNVGVAVHFNIANFTIDSGEVLIFEVSYDGLSWIQKATSQFSASPFFMGTGMYSYPTYLRIRYQPLNIISNTHTIQW